MTKLEEAIRRVPSHIKMAYYTRFEEIHKRFQDSEEDIGGILDLYRGTDRFYDVVEYLGQSNRIDVRSDELLENSELILNSKAELEDLLYVLCKDHHKFEEDWNKAKDVVRIFGDLEIIGNMLAYIARDASYEADQFVSTILLEEKNIEYLKNCPSKESLETIIWFHNRKIEPGEFYERDEDIVSYNLRDLKNTIETQETYDKLISLKEKLPFTLLGDKREDIDVYQVIDIYNAYDKDVFCSYAKFMDNSRKKKEVRLLNGCRKMMLEPKAIELHKKIGVGKDHIAFLKDSAWLLRIMLLEKYADKCTTPEITSLISGTVARDESIIDFVEKNKDHKNFSEAVSCLHFHALKKNDFKDYIDLFDKYIDNDEVFSYLYNSSGWYEHVKELLTDRAYNHLRKGLRAIQDILDTDFSVEEDRMDKEVYDKLSYKDMAYVKKTADFVREIHKNRGTSHKVEVIQNFYSEMNRAIAQADEFKEKRLNVLQYCTEVKQKMIENMRDLMVMRNV